MKRASGKLGGSMKNLMGAVKSGKHSGGSNVNPIHITPVLVSADLGSAANPEQEVAALREALAAQREANAALQQRLATASVQVPKVEDMLPIKDGTPPLPKNATAAAAQAHACEACGEKSVTSPVIVALLTLLRDNPHYKHLDLPQDDAKLLREFAGRMFMLADVDRDGVLSTREFALFWRHLPTSKAPSVLGERFGARYVSSSNEFVFGSREDWMGGLQQKLGAHVTRSAEVECTTNDGGVWKKSYEYFVHKPAKPEHRKSDGVDAHGEQIIFDEGHEGKKLADFQKMAEERGATLTLPETAMLRMYTADVRRPVHPE